MKSRYRIPRSAFIPATLPGCVHLLTDRTKCYEIDEEVFRFSWWEKDSFFYYPTFMASAYYGMKWRNFREEFYISPKVCFMGDSGGFQAVSILRKCTDAMEEAKGEEREKYEKKAEAIKEKLNPIKALRWQERNCNIGLALDIPLAVRGRGHSRKQFEESLKHSVRNYKIAIEKRRKFAEDGFLLYNVLHGRSISELNKWYDEIKDLPFDGWSVSMKPPSDPLLQAFALTFLLVHGITQNVHVLGVSGFDVIPTVIYASKWIDNLTFDSSTANMGGARFRGYHLPMGWGIYKGVPANWRVYFGKKGVTEDEWVQKDGKVVRHARGAGNLKRLPCDCPVCEKLRSPRLLDGEGTAPGGLISLHNVYVFLRYTKTLESLVDSDAIFGYFINKHCNSRTVRSVEVIGKIMENPTPANWRKVWYNYRALLNVTHDVGIVTRETLIK